MNKLAILNVGGAFSCYGELGEDKFVIDIGKSGDISPVDDFLIPLFSKRGDEKDCDGRFYLNQLFLSHLDNDHVAEYEKLRDNFFYYYMTCPSDNSKQTDKFKINRELIGELTDLKKLILSDIEKRNPLSENRPLQSKINGMELFFIYPENCEYEDDLRSGYANNISLILFLKKGDKSILIPGDILKKGMSFLIDNNSNFKNQLETYGIDYLIAPHHGLQTSFSQKLFDTIYGNKTRLNIISEKVRNADSNENRTDVDTRYYSSDYSTGDNTLGQNAAKTSEGHIVIDLDSPENEIKRYSDIGDVIKEFLN